MATKQLIKACRGRHSFNYGETIIQDLGQVGEATEAAESRQHLSYIMNNEQKFPEGSRKWIRGGGGFRQK